LEYTRGKFENGLLTVLTINGEKFRMYKEKYNDGKTAYTRPASFAEFLELNYIPTDDITIDQYNDFAAKLEAATEELKAALNKYDQAREAIKVGTFQMYGLVDQNNTHLYKYSAK
jgi:hypothetical protein